MKLFTVIDTETGEEPCIEEIAYTEPWAQGLIYSDMEGFFVGPNGELALLDECGNYAFPPEGRFKVVWEDE